VYTVYGEGIEEEDDQDTTKQTPSQWRKMNRTKRGEIEVLGGE
jgi:hypothetical protein